MPKQSQQRYQSHISDARGQRISQVDPVRTHLLNLPSQIPAGKLKAISDELYPAASRQRLIQVALTAFNFVVVGGGTYLLYRFVNPGSLGEPALLVTFGLQAIVFIVSPLFVYRVTRARYASFIAEVMLRHRYCPHCEYDLTGLPPDQYDGATVCPECGSAWIIPVDL